MNIIYIATDVTFPATNGGARRAYETAKIFKKFGHKAVLLVDQGSHDQKREIIDDLIVYRTKLFDIGKTIRNLIHSLKILSKPKSASNKVSSPSSPNEPSPHYETYFRNLMTFDFKYKIKDFYRHKFPLHKWLKILPAVFTLFHIIKTEKIDLIIERGPSYGVGAPVSQLLNRLYIVDFIDIMYCNFALRTADLILSYFTTVQIPPFISSQKVRTVYTCAEPQKFKPYPSDAELLKSYGLSTDDFICIYVGGMYPWHGLDTIIHASRLLKQQGKENVKFLLIGDGDVRSDLIRQVYHHHLQEMIKLPGKIPFDKVPLHLSSANVALSLNTGDAIGFKLLEYMASGTPIIATNADILQLAAQPEKEIILVDLFNPADLVEKILYLKHHPLVAKSIGQRARERVLNQYEWKHHYANIIQGILSILHEN